MARSLPVETQLPQNVGQLSTTCSKKKGKVFYGEEPPSGESTTTECGSIINYLQ